MFEGFNPYQIKGLEEAIEAIVRLLNLVESQKTEMDRLRTENQQFRDENNRLKGEQGQPKIKPNKDQENKDQEENSSTSNYSSEKERGQSKQSSSKGRNKGSKNDKIKIDREQVLPVEPEILPDDAEFKGYEDVIVQDIKIETDNVRFRKEKYYSPSEGKTYLAQLPSDYKGQFGPSIKAWVIVMYFAMNVSEPKIVTFFETVGIYISSSQISKIVLDETGQLHPEKEAIYEAGLRSTPWQQMDDTGIRVNGQNYYTHIICNPFYTVYFTMPHKNRLTVVQLLWGNREMLFCLNALAFVYLQGCGLSRVKQAAVAELPQNQMFTQAEFVALLQAHLPDLGPQQTKWILEGAVIAAYHTQDQFPIVQLLVCDDAGQFKRITEALALCWVHEGRHYKKLSPAVEYHRQLLADFLTAFWNFYHPLLRYRLDPRPEEQKGLTDEFDQLFAKQTGYEALDERIAKTKEKKTELLQILTHPEIPLHNNQSELAARQQKPKQNVSYGPRSLKGAKVWDTGLSIVRTATQLGVNIFAYFYDRVSGANEMPSLASLIEQMGAELQLGASWQDQKPP
jgi:hypothetical protein